MLTTNRSQRAQTLFSGAFDLPNRLIGALMIVCAILSTTSFTAEATAQDIPELQLQQFRPAPGPADYLNVYSTVVAPHLEFDMAFYLDYAATPLKVPSFEQNFNAVVNPQVTLSLLGSIGLFDIVEIGLLVPVTVAQSSGDLTPVLPFAADDGDSIEAFGLNDIRLSAKTQILDLLADPLGLAFILTGYIPTGMDDRFVGDDSFGLEALVSGETWLIRGIRMAINVGYRYRHNAVDVRESRIGDAILWGVGVNVPLFMKTLDLIAEVDGAVGVASKEEGRSGIQAGEVPAELKLAARFGLHEDWSLTAGMGFGLNSEAVGTPDFRAFVGLGGYWVTGGKWGFEYIYRAIYGALDPCEEADSQFIEGCPGYDSDGDGVPDSIDKCPNTAPGVSVGPDGCPDDSAFGEGVPEHLKRCPVIPGASMDFLDEDGCPYNPDDKVRISRDRIIITDQVYFDTARTTIKSESFEILDAVVEVMQANRQITKIRIEGHTDSRGAAQMNLELSQGRAESVMRYLTGKGVDADRLEAVGYGESQPIRSNDTAEGRSYNRRVEFTILEKREF